MVNEDIIVSTVNGEIDIVDDTDEEIKRIIDNIEDYNNFFGG